MCRMHPCLLVLFSLQAAAPVDTIRIEVGSKQLDGRVYAPHAARVQVRLDDSARIVSTWTNELTLGDSAAVQQVDVTLDRPGFFAGASDLVPLAVQGGLKAGAVITAPVWSPGMTAAEGRIFTTVGRDAVDVEGTRIEAWKVEERRQSDRVLLATWWLLDKSPYMVYGEVPLPSGRVRKMTEVEIPRPL